MDQIPISALFAATIILIMAAIEAGYRLGQAAHMRSANEKETAVSAMAGPILATLGFFLAFTFGMVTNRYDQRKALVYQEANAIGTAYLRADFMSEPDRSRTQELFREYVDSRLGTAQSGDLDQAQELLVKSKNLQNQLWDMAVANASRDMNSDVAALYVEALNDVIDIHAVRVAVALRARIPGGIWLALYAFMVLGMMAVGYQTAAASSTRRSWAAWFLAVSFSLVIALIATLDRPESVYITVSQQPLVDVRASMIDTAVIDKDSGG